MANCRFPFLGTCVPSALAVLALALVAAPVSAQEGDPVPELLPGDPRIDPTLFPNHAARWHLFQLTKEGEEVDLGIWMDRHEIVERDGRRMVLFQSDVLRHGEQPRRDLIHKDIETLEPLTVELTNYNKLGGWAYFHYDGPRFTLVWRRGPFEDVNSSHDTLERRVFDPGSGAGLLRFVNPKVGTAFRYPYHFRAGEGVLWATVRVTGEETLETPEGTLEALVVENNLDWKFWWIGRPPYVLRLEIPAAEGGTTVWDLLDYSILPDTAEASEDGDSD